MNFALKIWFNLPKQLCLILWSLLSWDVEGAVYGTKCGEIESGAALVFEREGRRKVCTPYLDTTSYGNLRFHFTMGKYNLNLELVLDLWLYDC